MRSPGARARARAARPAARRARRSSTSVRAGTRSISPRATWSTRPPISPSRLPTSTCCRDSASNCRDAGTGIHLNNAPLTVTLTAVPTPGASYTIVSNDGSDLTSGTFAGLPNRSVVRGMLGTTPYFFRVFYNTGHGHLGWTLSAVTAHQIAAQVQQHFAKRAPQFTLAPQG